MYATTLLDDLAASVAPVGEPIIFDSFAGGGGASTGIEMALGRSPDIAINHNPAALALHAANHPETLHVSENVYRIDPLDYLRGKHVGLAWFSPDCKHFSKAKGGKPVERNIRDLAWIIPGWIARIQKSGGRVDVVIMENVEEFSTWGPLVETEKGMMPDPDRRGATFKLWCDKLRNLGGRIETRELRACDYGAPTIRKRLFVIIRFDRKPIVWPVPTHGAPDDADVIAGRKLPWRTAAEIIDWSIPCPSIFDTGAEIFAKHGLRAVRPLADNTLARIARGMKRYVLDAERPFLVSIAHGDSGGRREYPVDEPFGVVTAGGISHAVIAPSVTRFNSGATGQDCREPLSTVTANSFIKRPGGAAPLGVVAPHLMTMRNAGKPFNGADEPTHTITAGGTGLSLVTAKVASGIPHHPLCSVHRGGYCDYDCARDYTPPSDEITAPVISYAQQGGGNRPVDEPHHTITASDKDQNQVIIPTLVGCGGRAAQSRPRSGDEPVATITAKADGCVAAAFMAQHNGDPRRNGEEAARPGRSAEDPLATVTASGTQTRAVAAFLAQNNYMEPGHDAREPMSTIVGKGSTQSVVNAHLTKMYGKSDGQDIDEPAHTIGTKAKAGVVAPYLSHLYTSNTAGGQGDVRKPIKTVVAGGGHASCVAPYLQKYYGTGDGSGHDEPCHTVTTKDRHGHVEAVLEAPPFTPDMEARARDVAAFLRDHGFWDEREFVTLDVGGVTFVIVDIGMRMLTPRELYNAQGFPADYEIERGPDGQVFTKSVQVSCVGNSVSPPVAAALVSANCGHLARMREAAE